MASAVGKRENPVWTKSRRLSALPELLRVKPRTTRELAEHFGVSQRDVQRDLESLRAMGEGLEEGPRGLYRLPSGQATLNAVQALAVHAAARLLYHHAPARNSHYRLALEKLAGFLPEPARSIAWRSAEDLCDRPGDDRGLELVAQAWFQRRVLAFDYLSTYSRSGTAKPNELEVYFVEVSRANLAPYAIGFERLYHRKVMTFKFSRMSNLRLLEAGYGIPADFDPRAYLSGAWGVVGTSGAEPVLVRLRFAPKARSRLLEGGYPNLTITAEHPDGSLEVTVRAGVNREGFPIELLSWVQSWGPRVEVLEPLRLREKWLEEARAVAVLGNGVE